MWNRQQMAQYGSSARYICLGGVLGESCPGVNDYSRFHFCWSLRSKPSRSADIPPPAPRSPTRSYSRYPLLRHSNGHNLGSSGRFSVFFRAAWVMEWSRKSYTRSYWTGSQGLNTARTGHMANCCTWSIDSCELGCVGGGGISVERLGFDRSDQQKWNPL